MEDPYKRALDTVTVEMWLEELRMECYRRNLEEYPNLKSVIDLKDVDFKRLGILNAKDRAKMIESLSKYNTTLRFQGFGSKSITQGQNEQQSLKKGSGIKIKKLKGLLGGNNQKKNKKSHEVVISSPHVSFEGDDGLQTIPEMKSRTDDFAQSLPLHQQNISSSLENLLTVERNKHYVVENDYVPDPQASPQLNRHMLQRSLTISEPPSRQESNHLMRSATRPQTTNFDLFLPTVPAYYRDHEEFDHLSPHTEDEFDYNAPSYSVNPNKHLSVVSMESGLGLTCDIDDKDDFNRTLPLDQQPWFHGTIGRGEAEALLSDDGDFLVHEDPIVKAEYTLTLMWDGRCYHLLINCNEVVMKGPEGVTTGHKYQFDNGAFDTVPELIYNHLRYRIPISGEFDGVLNNPICRIGSKGLGHIPSSVEPNRHRPYGTLPKNFGRSIDSNLERQVISPDLTKYPSIASLRGTRSVSFSPAGSPRQSPSRDIKSYSSSNLLIERDLDDDEDEISNQTMASMYKDVPPSPTELRKHDAIPDEVRPRTISPYSTYDIPVPSATVRRQTVSEMTPRYKKGYVDPDDYEVMGSVCIRSTLPPSPRSSYDSPQYSTVAPKPLRQTERSFPFISSNPGVKYAEISFRSSTTSKLDVMARNRAQSVTYVTPRLIREEIANAASHGGIQPHPFSTYSQYNSRNSSTLTASTPPKPRRATSSPKTITPNSSPYSSRPASVISRNVKAPQTISDVPTFLKEFTNEEISMHLTKADAVCFLLAPRPGEDFGLWKNRVVEVSANSGVLVGLEILGSQAGEKLWKKLFYRHLSTSQLIIVSLVHILDVVERSKMMKRWIEIANLLQSGTYGNLFSFMSIMKGLESPQVIDMKKTWEVLKTHYNEVYTLYEGTLKGMISALSEGAPVYAIEQLTVPAIQHLRKLYCTDNNAIESSQDLRLILEDFTTRTVGLDGLHSIVSHTTDLSNNAKKRLTVYSYDALLFDFLMQDCTRTHLQNMGTSSDDPLERYRRFNIVLDALLSKLDNP